MSRGKAMMHPVLYGTCKLLVSGFRIQMHKSLKIFKKCIMNVANKSELISEIRRVLTPKQAKINNGKELPHIKKIFHSSASNFFFL